MSELGELQKAIRAVLPSAAGAANRPDSDVIVFYITLGELRALRALSTPSTLAEIATLNGEDGK